MDKYAESGVNIELEGKAIKSLVSELKTDLNGIFAKYDYKYGKALGFSSDGIGSKILCYQAMGDFSNIGYDLVAMNVNDLACEFIPPLYFVNCLSTNKPDPELSKELGKSLKRACELAKVIPAGGEFASLPDQIKEDTFDWIGFVFGMEDEDKHRTYIKKRNNLEPGLNILGIKSSGIHSNGLTLARKLYEDGIMDLDDEVPGSDKTLGEELTTPTKIYSPLMTKLRDDVEFFTHITGGGFKNLLRVLPPNLYARLEISEVDPIFELIQEKLNVPEREMYSVFNMGIGLVVGVKKENKEKVTSKIEKEKEICLDLGSLVKGERKVVINKEIILQKY